MVDVPLTGWPRDVFPLIVRFAEEIVDHNSIEEFYIGRSVDLAERKSYHGAAEIIPLYYTESSENAKAVENALLGIFGKHEKCNNEAQHSAGRVSEEYGTYVYMAIWVTEQ